MDMSLRITVNPDVLVWARQERGMTKEEAAEKLGIDTSRLERWETDGDDVPFDALQVIAKTYKRQTATFFLPDAPPKTQKIKDCRNLVRDRGHFSPDTLLAIRRTSRYLDVARDIVDGSYWNSQYAWLKEFDGKRDHREHEAVRLREILKAPLTEQLKQRQSADAFRYWRQRIEEQLGIFVFQFSMPENELDGFSYAFDTLPYAIVVNNKQAPVRKIFTLFHELAHIVKHNPGVCRIGDAIVEERKPDLELECNSFAGKFLVPTDSVKITTSIDEIFDLAALFNVSGEVYLRRMFEEAKLKPATFFKLLEEVRDRSRSFRRPKQNGAPSMVIQSKSTRGNTFFTLVVDAAIANQLSFSTASDLLGLKPGSIRS
jgi:Zn-dependent peptidase ImmA (M78 family)